MKTFASLLILAVLAIPAGVYAGDHQADVFMAASYLDASGSRIKLSGWHTSVAVTLPEKRWLGVTLDVSGHFLGGDDNDPPPTCGAPPCPQSDRTQLTFMMGPRFTPFKDESPLHMFFAHALFGAVHRSGGPQIGGATSGALAFGAGYDFPVTTNDVWIPRVQVDYVLPVSSDVGRGLRFSAGLIYRLKE